MTETATEIPQSTADALVMAFAMLHDAQLGCDFLPVEHPLREAVRDCAAAAELAIHRLIDHGGADAMTRVVAKAYEFGASGAALAEEAIDGADDAPKLTAAEQGALRFVVTTNLTDGPLRESARVPLAGLLVRSQPFTLSITPAGDAASEPSAPQTAPRGDATPSNPDESAPSSSPSTTTAAD